MQKRKTVRSNWASAAMVLFLAVVLTACGGEGGGSDGGPQSVSTVWQSGVFKPAGDFADRCQIPRSGTDPATGEPYPDRLGTGLDERNFLRSWSNDTYLWYDEIVDVNPANYGILEYFDILKTEALTPSGNPKDRYHFYMPTEEYQALAQSGVSVGYGATWSMIQAQPPRNLVIAYVEPNSPAAAANLLRGSRVLSIDGEDLIYGNDVDTLNAGLSPSSAGESHIFRLSEPGGAIRTVTLSSANVTTVPVAVTKTVANGEVGYLLFNDHIATAEAGLKNAIETLQAQNIQDLVLDVRYNGGGYLAIASQLAYMIAGPTRINTREFETLTFNDKHASDNRPTPFHSESLGFSLAEGQPLPTLNLPRVFVLTGPDTCSASESIINGLRGVDLEVIQIGATTCGKPYGFYPADNCGTTYFTIQFKGENAKGFGDYPDGFSAQNAAGDTGVRIPGCDVGDDFTSALGDPSEGRLAAALHYRNYPNDPCGYPTATAQYKTASPVSTLSAIDGRVIKPRALQGRIMEK